MTSTNIDNTENLCLFSQVSFILITEIVRHKSSISISQLGPRVRESNPPRIRGKAAYVLSETRVGRGSSVSHEITILATATVKPPIICWGPNLISLLLFSFRFPTSSYGLPLYAFASPFPLNVPFNPPSLLYLLFLPIRLPFQNRPLFPVVLLRPALPICLCLFSESISSKTRRAR